LAVRCWGAVLFGLGNLMMSAPGCYAGVLDCSPVPPGWYPVVPPVCSLVPPDGPLVPPGCYPVVPLGGPHFCSLVPPLDCYLSVAPVCSLAGSPVGFSCDLVPLDCPVAPPVCHSGIPPGVFPVVLGDWIDVGIAGEATLPCKICS